MKNKEEIIGNSYELESIEVARHDFPNEMNWDDANKACASLGYEWRLPTIDELDLVYENSDVIGGFEDGNLYWSSTEVDDDHAWFQYFGEGPKAIDHRFPKNWEFKVRAVRTLYELEIGG